MAKRKKRGSSRRPPARKERHREEQPEARWSQLEEDLRGLRLLNSMQLRVIRSLEEAVQEVRASQDPPQ